MGRVPLPAVCDGDTVELQSKAGKPLTRYFPELVVAARKLAAETPAMMIVFDLLISPTAAFATARA